MASKAKRIRKAESRAKKPSKPREIGAAAAAAAPTPVVEAKVKEKAGPPVRDGLLWLATRKGERRLSRAQVSEGMYYRDLFHAPAGGATASCLEALGMGGGAGRGGGLAFGGSFDDSAKSLELFVIREHLFGGQKDMIEAMDGVCGQGWTLRYLAGNDHHRAGELEVALTIALDLMVENRRKKAAAQARLKKAA